MALTQMMDWIKPVWDWLHVQDNRKTLALVVVSMLFAVAGGLWWFSKHKAK